MTLKHAFELYKAESPMTAPQFIAGQVLTDSTDVGGGDVSRLCQNLDMINKARIAAHRIATTMNNNGSSRSHMFLVLSVQQPGVSTGYLTVVDMAGRESPLDLIEWTIKHEKFKYPQLSMTSGITSAINPANKDLLVHVRESVFVNETINHLTYYLKYKASQDKGFKFATFDQVKKAGSRRPAGRVGEQKEQKQTAVKLEDFNNYSEGYFAKDPSTEVGQPRNVEKVPSVRDNTVGMVTILEWLNALGGAGRPAKFVMVCTVRPGQGDEEAIKKTLQFAASVSSYSSM